MAEQVRVRRDVWTLDPWDPTLVWYADAILEMQRRPINDPTSWRYQGAIHDYASGFDPLASPSDQLPSPAERRRFWRQCQHFSWYFLPWHRMYLAYFEQIIAGIVADRGGPDDWALPYWNYSDAGNPNARKLPPAFREPALPDGRANPLRIDARFAHVNQGDDAGDAFDVDLSCLTEPRYTPIVGVALGFGGPQTGFNHSSGGAGAVETVPHGAMHMAVGGWMQGFHTAALDPIFWLHHCNIDRLWSVWLNRDPTHANPGDPWLGSIAFPFHDAARAVVTVTAGEVVDTETTPPLGYRYDDISDPLAPPVVPEEAERGAAMDMDEEAVPEMVGATEQPVTLAGEPVTAAMPVGAPAGPAAGLERAAAGPPARIYLNFEDITGSEPTSYAVYLNVPEGERPEDHPELFAGLLPMFGVAEASREDDGHPGSGLHYVLEVGQVVRALEAREGRAPERLEVTFVPRHRGGVAPAGVEPDEATRATPEAAPIQVGRISVYVA